MKLLERTPRRIQELKAHQEYLVELVERTPEDLYSRLADIHTALHTTEQNIMRLETKIRGERLLHDSKSAIQPRQH